MPPATALAGHQLCGTEPCGSPLPHSELAATVKTARGAPRSRGNAAMYARSTTFRGDPAALDDGIAYTRDKVLPAVQQMDGCIGLSMLVDRGTGRCLVTTSWDAVDARHRSAEAVRGIRETAISTVHGVESET